MKGRAGEFPEEFKVGVEPQATRYVVASGYYAVRGSLPAGQHDVVSQLEDPDITICRGVPDDEIADAPSTPLVAVYHVGQAGPLAVPTGDVFVRFGDKESLQDKREAIEKAGFSINQVLSYAPQAGWVRPTSGEVHDALTGFRRLEQIAGVQSVEPQMLTPLARR